MKYDYDVAVIGSGSGGLTVAFGLAGSKKVVLIEKGKFGGDCTNYGCVPSKALIDISKSGKYDNLKDALKEVRERRQIIQDEETKEQIESHGLKVLEGTASFEDEHTLSVEGKDTSKISAKNIVIASGSSPKVLPLEGVDEKDILTNETIFEQTEDIKKLVIIGGGYIGCELAEAIAGLGTQVHLVQRNTDLIPQEDKESRDLLKKIFKEKGIQVHTGYEFESNTGKTMTIKESKGEKTKTIQYDKILVAFGRQPNTKGLELEKAEIAYDKTGISTNKNGQTNKKHIYAIGDCVKGDPQFTHYANHEGRGVIRNILVPFYKKSVKGGALPAVLYTSLEVARVGKTRDQILKTYAEEDIVTKIKYFKSNDRSKVTEDTNGFVLIHFTRVRGKILGATVFGKHAGEILSQITLAMDNGLSAYKLAKSIQPYPTKSDLVKRTADSFVVHTLTNFKGEAKYFLKSNILQICTALIWLAIVASFFYYKITNNLTFEQIAIDMYNFLGSGIIGIILYIILYTFRPIILFPGSIVTFLSGALFGFIPGLVATLIGGTLSAVFAYLLGGIFGKKLVSSEDAGFIGKLKAQLQTSPFVSVLMTRILFFPFDLTNYACGFLKAPFFKYILATFIGIIPGSSVFVLAGSAFQGQEITSLSEALSNVDTSYLIYAAILFVITLIVAKVIKRYTKNS